MTYSEIVITGPTVEPVLKAAIKTHLRISHTDDDTYIDGLAKAARERIEHETGRALITQTWDLFLDEFPSGDVIQIPRPPLQVIGYIKYYSNAVLATMSTDDYVVDLYSLVGRVVLAYGSSWPVPDVRPQAVQIRYTAGYGAAGSNCPGLLIHGVTLYAAHLYENRLPVDVVQFHKLPMGIQAIVNQFRVFTV